MESLPVSTGVSGVVTGCFGPKAVIKQSCELAIANLFEVQKYATDWGALFAGLVIVMIPTIIIYLIGQRYLLQGIGAGGLKG